MTQDDGTLADGISCTLIHSHLFCRSHSIEDVWKMLNGKFELYKLQQLRKNGFECQEEQEYHPQTSQKQPESEDQQDIEEIRAYGKLNSRLKLVT